MNQSELKNNTGGFKMPVGFLAHFEEEILQKIHEEVKPKKYRPIIRTTWMAIGLSIAASLIIGMFFIARQENSSSLQEFSELDWDQYASFEESWIVQELSTTDVVVTDDEYALDINMLMYAGITNDEILEAFQELPNEE
ncbi:hypothetical protein [Lentimicrobium sp. S6]|nr:hypothetical protein [Lentimicrobium sp. S6]NPD45204.1 hypothetical protein [Lentimicrobium sp. S6]NPD86574.1 hypothetical protein [Lentimicrobium sp. L6]